MALSADCAVFLFLCSCEFFTAMLVDTANSLQAGFYDGSFESAS